MIGAEMDRRFNKIAGKVFAIRSMEKGVYFDYFGLHAEVAYEMDNNLIPKHTFENVQKYSQGIGYGQE
jgi:hypothetical protein